MPCSPQIRELHMTSTTPDHENSSPDANPSDSTGVPFEPVQPTSTEDVYDVTEHGAAGSAASEGLDESSSPHRGGAVPVTAPSFGSEEPEPYPIGATDAEPAPATTEGGADDEIVVDYASAQEPDDGGALAPDATGASTAEPPLTKPSPEPDHHPYPPQALGEPAPVTDVPAGAGVSSSGGVAAVAAAGDGRDRADDDRAGERADDRDRVDASDRRPVYVQAPTPPKAKGNRGFGVLIGVLATLVFAALYFAALLLTPLLSGNEIDVASSSMALLSSAAFFIPVIVFFLAWVLLVVVLTRAPWWAYVIGGLIVGLLTYAGALAGALIHNAFDVAPSQVADFLLANAFSPATVFAFVIAREVPIWFGVWVGKRGRAVRERNAEAREEYERVLEAGPSARA
jgi:hypothetical protein